MSASKLRLRFSVIHPDHGQRAYSLDNIEPTALIVDIATMVYEEYRFVNHPHTLLLYNVSINARAGLRCANVCTQGAGLKFTPDQGQAFHAELVAKQKSGQLQLLVNRVQECIPEQLADGELNFYAFNRASSDMPSVPPAPLTPSFSPLFPNQTVLFSVYSGGDTLSHWSIYQSRWYVNRAIRSKK